MKKKSGHRRRTKMVRRSRKNLRRTIKRKSLGKGRRRPTRRYSRIQRGGMTEEEKLEEEEEEALEELIEKLESGIKKNDKDDFKNAFIEIKKKANGGYAKAQFALGEFYFYKNGGYDYDNKAVRWYHLAAKQGHARARYMLGLMFENGRGVAQNREEAVKWRRLAGDS